MCHGTSNDIPDSRLFHSCQPEFSKLGTIYKPFGDQFPKPIRRFLNFPIVLPADSLSTSPLIVQGVIILAQGHPRLLLYFPTHAQISGVHRDQVTDLPIVHLGAVENMQCDAAPGTVRQL